MAGQRMLSDPGQRVAQLRPAEEERKTQLAGQRPPQAHTTAIGFTGDPVPIGYPAAAR